MQILLLFILLFFSSAFTQNLDFLLDASNDYAYNLFQSQCSDLSVQTIGDLDLISLVQREHESAEHNHEEIGNNRKYLEISWLETGNNVNSLSLGLRNLYRSTKFETSHKLIDTAYLWIQFFAHGNWQGEVEELFEKCSSLLEYR